MKTKNASSAAGFVRAVATAVFASCAFAAPAAAPFAPGEKNIPNSQGSRTNPAGDEIAVTSKCLRFNGEPAVPVMGEMHYARVPENEWRGYVRKMKAGGLDIIAAYVFWIHHEEFEGKFDFSGRRDIRKFLQICRDEGMKVVLRIGPWCHGECVYGGFPGWLVSRRGVRLRTTDPRYMECVGRWWRRLFREVDGFLWKQGGPVIGVQIENESAGPWSYLKALKDLCREAGFDVPFYTRTGWPRMKGPAAEFGELLPLFGNYADGFWDRNFSQPSPGDYLKAFEFSKTRVSSQIATEMLPQSSTDDKATAEYPYFTCELGGGMTSSYHRRIRISPMDTYTMALVKLGSGSNLLGYYMYAGGTNPNRPEEGVFFNEHRASRYTNGNDLPPFSYEFLAPISEFGETTASWELLKPLHKFCANFGPDFALADAEVESRTDSRRGPFRFHNEYVRTKSEDKIPYIFPQNWKTRLGTVKSATAQPVEWRGDTLVMMKIPGIEPKVEFEGAPFKVEFIDFPARTEPGKRIVAEVKTRKTKEAAPPREIKRRGRARMPMQPSEADWDGAAVWEVELPDGTPRNTVLEAEYLGDVARVYVDGVPVADDFYKGRPLRCALWRIPKGKTTIRILPWSDSPLIYVQPPFRPKEKGAAVKKCVLVDAGNPADGSSR